MTPPHPQQSRRLGALAAAVALAAASPAVTGPEPALAGTFTVAACDAAGGPSGSWTPQAGSVDAFKICPSSNLPGFGGMGTRLAGRTFASGEFSRLWFFAPAGTTISGLTWAGAYSHNCDVRWANQIRAQGTADVNLFGTTGAFAFCPSTGEYAPTWLAAPPGTTRLLQNTQCSQASCASGAAFRTRSAAVVIDDPTPPSLAITGGGLSGAEGWVRGPQALRASAGDVTGIKLVRMQIAGYPGAVDSAKPCDYSTTAPCAAGNGDTALGVRTTAELADGPHAVTVTAYDAAGNAASRETVAKVDNGAPAPPPPALEGGSGWRASNAYTLRWAAPEAPSPSRAPVTAARYQVCPAGANVGCAPTRTVSEPSPTDVSPKAPGEGEFDVRVALVDAAGNGAGADARWSEPVLMRYDPDAAQLRAGVITSAVRRKRVTVRGRRRVVRRRVVRLAPSKRVRYGRRFEVAGTLTSRSGQPRVNTTIEVYGRSDSLGGPESLLGLIRTDTGGRFRYRAEARQSHTLRFVRRASTATVRVRVPARLSFAARPRSVINGEAVILRGRVLGTIPAGGKQLVIQAYSRGRWRTFQLLRTDAQGRYRHVYRFDGTRGRAVYPLRAVTTREATFAHEPGRSKVRRVTVRGL